MGKVEKAKKGGAASSSPYDRKSSAGKGAAATKNNVFKFNKDFGQHILKNPGVADGQSRPGLLQTNEEMLTWLRQQLS
jgi:18S rRNA (adenine1779-N6/adenine1780-N6)-dimethyltransferase